jgi:hypothetical protein
LKEDPSELLMVYSQAEEHLNAVVAKVDAAWDELVQTWEQTWQIESQKKFAQAIVKNTRFAGLLFRLRKQCGEPNPSGGFFPGFQTKGQLRELWRNSSEMITKILFK